MLREKADIRTLLFAFGLFPAVVLSQYLFPVLLGWMLPIGLFVGACSGAQAHNQNHTPVFRSKRLNAFYSSWLSVFYGYPIFAWIPTHNQNHHKLVNRPGDATITWRYSKRHTWTIAWTYFFVSVHFQGALIKDYLRKVRVSKPEAFREIIMQYVGLVGTHGALLALALTMHGTALGLWVYGVAMLVPTLFANWSMIFLNYIQHVHCDPWSRYNHSRNFVGKVENWLMFNNGLHAAHHEQAGLHWSKLPELHAKLAPNIDPELNQPGLFRFMLHNYVLGQFSDRFRTHQIGRPAWEPPDGRTEADQPEVAPTGAGVNATMA